APRSAVIASYALCGFANFGSLAIMVGGIGGAPPPPAGAGGGGWPGRPVSGAGGGVSPGRGGRGMPFMVSRRGGGVRSMGWGGSLLALSVLLAAPAAAQPSTVPHSYPVSAFVIEYPLPHPELPTAEELLDLEVEMRVTRGGLMQPHETTQNVRFRL